MSIFGFNKFDIKGKNNIVVAVEDDKLFKLGRQEIGKLGKIKIHGNNNTIYVGLPLNPAHINITILSDNNVVKLGKNCIVNDTNILMERGNGNYLCIGDNTYIQEIHIYISAGAKCDIGKDCLISSNIQIWASDFHALIDKKTKQVINIPQDSVVIGDHCWIGANAILTKRAKIPNNSVVANSAVVSKAFYETNTVFAGNPAKIVKRNIDWDKKIEIY